MSEQENSPNESNSQASQKLEGGAYEVIRARLDKQGGELRSRLDDLNHERKEIFGAVEASLISTQRVTTEHNCVPRDLIAIGNNRFLFGYNIQFGLKQTTEIRDVIAAYQYDPSDHTFHSLDIEEVLASSEFTEDFAYLYKYYKQTVFLKMMVIGPYLYMALQVGKDISDIKTFKWLLKGDGTLSYEGNRFDHEYVYPAQHEFDWKRCHRDMHRGGEHPHISIEDRVFVETVGGDLTIKVEDNTLEGEGIYQEEVMDKDQSLDDAEIYYASVGPLILLKILPYREKAFRYFVFNEKNHSVHRVDSIGTSCVMLPEDHGIIFSNGFYLLSGELKTFDHGLIDMRFERRINSANGEDTLYAFYNRVSGEYVLLSYNLIEQTVGTPVLCHGYSVFENGELVYFKTEDAAQKHHALQIWQTPILSEEAVARQQKDEKSYLFQIGNADIVAAMAECQEVLTLLAKDDNYGGLYIDLSKKTRDLLDSYFWIKREETKRLDEPIEAIHAAANSAMDEFDKVKRLRKAAKDNLESLLERSGRLLRETENSPPDDILGFVKQLSALRTLRGEVIGLRETRYMNLEALEELEQSVIGAVDSVSNKTVEFLLKPEALDPYREKVDQQRAELGKLEKVTEIDQLAEFLNASGLELEMLIDVVSNLKIEDSTVTTSIIDSISNIFATLNTLKVELKNKRTSLAKSEGVAQFSAQMKLLSQAIVNYLDLCDTTEKTESYLTKVMVQIEELEGKFSEFDDYVEQLSAKREEVYNAFESRKQQLVEKRSKRSNTLVKSSERILTGIANRINGFKEINEINGYFASDLMVEKVRDIITQLNDLGNSVKADDIQTRMKTIREDTVRQLKDRQELYVDGENVIRFGKHAFNVNVQELELSIVPKEETMCFHLSGTNFFEPIEDEAFLATEHVWQQEIISENKQVYRVEYLVYKMLESQLFDAEQEAEIELVQKFMQPRYAEAYTKGVHDEDALRLLKAILPIHRNIGLLRYDARDRAMAMLFWENWSDEQRDILTHKIQSHRKRKGIFETQWSKNHKLCKDLSEALASWLEGNQVHSLTEGDVAGASQFLLAQLIEKDAFVVSPEAASWVKKLRHALVVKHAESLLDDAFEELGDSPIARFEIAYDWLKGLQATATESSETDEVYLLEAAAHLACGGYEQRSVHDVSVTAEVVGMIGDHMVVDEGVYHLNYSRFLKKLSQFEAVDVVTFEQYQSLKHAMIEQKRESMRLDEFKPKVMSAFVRNKLINNVYLPMVGDNFAKQLGTAGDSTRTDRMGMLLLISPPGYGKTTIMEYVANRLGLTFMKINGPALGHDVVSLDPAEAPNATAAQEVKKLNLALEMGDNVLIYLDDIQHTHSEFLQKFISLCDGQRKIEGVYNGVARTYDLRGKKVGVVMAGNPYTETGGKFQIPDMLANRADTYNLGDIIGGHSGDFEASYIENALTSNQVLSKLSSKSQKDVYAVMKIVEQGSQEGVDFEGNYTPAEVDEMVRVCQHLNRVRDSILRVNLQYIASAAQEDAYRVEPAFKLQGSYRNMNRIAEKILPLMTAEEVESIIVDHYENESQTLTSGAEANLLKFKEMEGIATAEESERWEQIKKDFNKGKLLGAGGENDPVARVVAQLSGFNDSLESIREGIAKASQDYTKPQSLHSETIQQLEAIISGLRAVPVEVDINVMPVEEAVREKGGLPVDIDTDTRQG